jgi:hypothetical protein
MADQTKEQFFTKKFDNDFCKIKSEKVFGKNVFNRFPRMMPMVGADYEKQPVKILLVLESYYFNNDDLEKGSVFKEDEKWYKTEGATLIPEKSEDKINLRHEWICNPKKGTFLNICSSLKEVRGGNSESQWRSVAIYNYFLRPAFNNNGTKGFGDKDYCTDNDREVACDTFCGVVDTLKPNIVVFLSIFSFDTFQKLNKSFENIKIEYTPHPSSRDWKNGQLFKNILIENWVQKNPMNEIVFQKLKTIHNILLSKFEKESYKPSKCIIWDGHFNSFLYLKANDETYFCCQTSVKINGVVYSSYFYEDKKSKKIPALKDKEYEFTPDFTNDTVVNNIEKLINQVIEEVS